MKLAHTASAIAYQSILSQVGSARERWKLKIGKLLFPTPTSQWVHFVHAHPHLSKEVANFPKLVTKIFRPYVSRQFNCQRRVDHLIQHYKLVDQLGLGSLMRVAAQQPLLLAHLETKFQQPLELQLSVISQGHREGEIGLHLIWQGESIFSLTCSLIQWHGGVALKVAKIQGAAHPEARGWIRDATKACHGARPASLLLQAAQTLGRVMGCHQVVLIGNQNRVALNPFRRWKINANYDALWEEHEATLMDNGNYLLHTATASAVDFNQVPSQKRAQVRRKVELLDQLKSQLSANMARLQTAPAVSLT